MVAVRTTKHRTFPLTGRQAKFFEKDQAEEVYIQFSGWMQTASAQSDEIGVPGACPWRRFGDFAAEGKVTRAGARNIPCGGAAKTEKRKIAPSPPTAAKLAAKLRQYRTTPQSVNHCTDETRIFKFIRVLPSNYCLRQHFIRLPGRTCQPE